MSNPFYAEGEVYQVAAVRSTVLYTANNPDWYEYRVRLCRSADRATVAEWDSFDECYKYSTRRLTEHEATEMVAQIVYEVGQGRFHEWFSTRPDGCEKVSPGSDRQAQPDILLEPLAVLEAAHTVFSMAYASEVEEYETDTGDMSFGPTPGGNLCDWAPRQQPADILPIVWYLIGRIEQAWGAPVGLVFHHGGITSLADQEHALSDLLLGCLGHGVCLADDYSEHLAKAEDVFEQFLDPTPIDTEGEGLRRLAEAAICRTRQEKL